MTTIKINRGLIWGIFLLTVQACTDREGAIKTIKHFGFKPITVGGYSFFSGSNGDFYCTNFIAIDSNGDTIQGVVTKGLIFKGSTIRIKDK